jgi:hypothetical protein
MASLDDYDGEGDCVSALEHGRRRNKQALWRALETDGTLLKCADESFQSDRATVLVAVKQNGTALRYASLALKGDKDVVLVSVSNDPYGQALGFATEGAH